MIYEMRTYDLKPHSVREVEKRFDEAYELHKKHSPLAAFGHAETGQGLPRAWGLLCAVRLRSQALWCGLVRMRQRRRAERRLAKDDFVPIDADYPPTRPGAIACKVRTAALC